MKEIFPEHTIKLPEDFNIIFNFDETGTTFLENALGKALTLHTLTEIEGIRPLPILADDSGLCVRALQWGPGIYTARYGSDEFGNNLSAPERNSYLLENMKPHSDRYAYYVCCLALVFGKHRFFTSQEIFEGEIARQPAGTAGFGYDPVFYVPEYKLTVAEMDSRLKHQLSHRGKASQALKPLLQEAQHA
jgi:XTP/dITP diphosphohydrolase